MRSFYCYKLSKHIFITMGKDMVSLKHCRYNQIDKMSKTLGVVSGSLSQFCKIFIDSSLNYYLIILFQRQNSQADRKLKIEIKKKKQQQQQPVVLYSFCTMELMNASQHQLAATLATV